jgi:hypothetical protein
MDEITPFNEQLLIDELARLRSQVEQLTADAVIRADRQAILIDALLKIRNTTIYPGREYAARALIDIGEAQP